MGLNLTPDRDARTRAQWKCDSTAAIYRVYRLARVLVSGMEQLDRGVYRIEPADVLALRSALVEAGLVISTQERNSK